MKLGIICLLIGGFLVSGCEVDADRISDSLKEFKNGLDQEIAIQKNAFEDKVADKVADKIVDRALDQYSEQINSTVDSISEEEVDEIVEQYLSQNG